MFLCGHVWAQDQQHYVYIQSEKGQPFYVKLNGKLLSSTDRGYIILPRLESGTTPLTVGFPKNEGPEQKFYVKIARNDQGYLLKKAGESGYTLYNLQTFREIKADNGDGTAAAIAAAEPEPEPAQVADVAAYTTEDTARKEMMGNLQKDLETTFANKAIVTGPGKPVATASKAGNSFASALDKVVITGEDRDIPLEEVKPTPVPTDMAVTEEPVVKKANKKRKGSKAPLTEEEQAILNDVLAQESKTAASEAAAAEALKAAAPEEDVEAAPKKARQRKKRAGDPDFIEFQDDDTPPAAAATPAPVEEAVVTPSPDMPAVTDETPARSKKKRRKIFDDTEHPANIITDSSGYGIAVTREEEPVKSKKRKKHEDTEMTVDPETGAVSGEVSKKGDSRLINSDCENVMNDDTFRKVLRKFVSAKSDDGMIDVFRKQTRNYCMETAQIRTLAQLVTAEDARYRLLDLAYSKTYDTEKYGSLENLLNESYYKGRFKAMLHK
ncbi:DUF4476 domain-containing protein [Chitinophaga sp. MM2321]|uniref:DUF4476 domain-containing protein n=1 Tax=Chitinophaga sp. MM2321 TaxID=3137178 RepID=UPI0032D5ADC5